MKSTNLYLFTWTVEKEISWKVADIYTVYLLSWWRHQMETFSVSLAICAGNSPVPGEFPSQRPVTRIFDVFFDLCLNKRLSKQSWGWWFETLSRPLWRHCNVFFHWQDDWQVALPHFATTAQCRTVQDHNRANPVARTSTSNMYNRWWSDSMVFEWEKSKN